MIVLNNSVLSWWEVPGCVPHVNSLGPLWFSIFINDFEDGIEHKVDL